MQCLSILTHMESERVMILVDSELDTRPQCPMRAFGSRSATALSV